MIEPINPQLAPNGENKPTATSPSRRSFLKSAAITLAGVATSATAIGAAGAATKPPAAKPGAAVVPPPAGKAPYPAWVDANYDDTTKDYEKLDGVLTFYRYRNDLLVDITPAQLGKLYMLEATRSTGTADPFAGLIGDPLGDVVFTLQKQNDQIYLIEPNIAFRAQDKSPEKVSVGRSFADGFLGSFPIAAVKLSAADKKKADAIKDKADKANFIEKSAISYLCPLKTFFLADITGFLDGMQGYHPDADKSFIRSVKVFPTNMVVTSMYAFTGKPAGMDAMFGYNGTLADSRSFSEVIVYNLFTLPDNGYKPRYYDDRVGYFTTDYLTFDEDTSSDNVRRMIQRWNLVKKDPKASLSEPVKPITWWVDNGTPERYRKAIQEGVLSWNTAFEKIGYKNAIVCNIMPDNADWDTADMRYNVIRWMTSPGFGYAVSLMRSNPFTGEFVAASINIDASMARFTNLDYPVDVTILSGMASTPAEAAQLPDDKKTPKAIAQSFIRPRTNKPVSMSKCTCDIGPGSRMHAGFGWNAIDLLGEMGVSGTLTDDSKPISLEDYTHSYLRMVTAHEMGHCLGLRHNFRASTMLTIEQLQDPATVAKYGISGSLMDYLPANLAPLGGHQTIYHQQGPGPYDQWAIQYGYSDFGHDLPSMDLPPLRAIASRGREFGHDFASDEAMYRSDPTIMVFDLSSDPLGYNIATMERGFRMMDAVGRKYPAEGDPYYELTQKFMHIALHTVFAGLNTSYFLGGVITERNHRGDPGAGMPIQPVSFADQRRALGAICKYIFADGVFNVSPELLAQLQQNPAPYSDNPTFSTYAPLDFSYLDLLSSVQAVGLYVVLDPIILGRLETNEYRTNSGQKPLTVLETMQSVTDSVWSELVNGRKSELRLTPLRRRLQRAHVDALESLTQPSPYMPEGDSSSFALHSLRSIVAMIDGASKRPCDSSSRVHLAETRTRISRILHTQKVMVEQAPMM